MQNDTQAPTGGETPANDTGRGHFWHYFETALLLGGIPERQLPDAYLILATALSVRTGYPLALVLAQSEDAGAVRMLDRCIRFMPQGYVVEMDSLKKRDLDKYGPELQGKVVVAHSLNLSKKDLGILATFIARHRKTAWILVDDDLQTQLKKSSIFLCKDLAWTPDLENDLERGKQWADSHNFSAQYEAASKFIANQIERLAPLPVDLPFLKQVRAKIGTFLGSSNYLMNLTKLMKVVTIIGQTPPFSPQEVQARGYGLTLEEFTLLQSPLPPQGHLQAIPGPLLPALTDQTILQAAQQPGLTMTLEDYNLFYWLAQDLLPPGEEQLTPRQQLIRDIIKGKNEWFVRSSLHTHDDPFDMLEALHLPDSDRGWASTNDIVKWLSDNDKLSISRPTLSRELGKLVERKVLAERKSKQQSNEKIYAVLQFDDSNVTTLPRASELQAQGEDKNQGEQVMLTEIEDSNM